MTDFRKLSDDEIIAALQERLGSPNSPKGVPWASPGVGGKPDVMGQFGAIVRGIRDPIDAGAQFAVRAANAVNAVPDSEVKRVEDINRNAERDYQENWRGGNAPPIDVPRILGAGAVGGVAAAPAKMAPTLAGRMGQAGTAGGFGGFMTPVNEPQSNADFFTKKAAQTGAGFVTGSLGQPALEGLGATVSKIAAAVTNRAAGAARTVIGDASEEAAKKIASASLAKSGVNFDQLERGVQKSLIADVQEAMRKYGGVSAAAVQRQADFGELGVEPLKAWVTRDPVDFGKARNLSKTDAGDALKRARADLDAKLIGTLEGLRAVNAGSQYEAGTAARTALQAHHDKARAGVTTLYDRFNAVAPNVAADPKRLVNTILDRVEGESLGDFLRPELRNLVNSFAAGQRPTTPASLYRAQQIATREVMKGGNEGRAARIVVEGIDNELEQMGRDMSAVGPEMAQAAELLKRARAAHRTLKMQEEAIPALKAVADGTFEAEKFLSNYIVGGSVNEVAAMWSAIKDPGLKTAARSQIVDALKDAARGKGQSDEAATFAQARFSQLLGSPGFKEKLSIILGPGGLKKVGIVQRAAESAIKIPAGSEFNTSGSAMELFNLSRRIPFLGPLVADPMKGMVDEVATQAAMKGGAKAIASPVINPDSEEMLRLIRRSAGLLAPSSGTAIGGLLGGSR